MKLKLVITVVFAIIVVLAAMFYILSPKADTESNDANKTVLTGNAVANASDDIFGGESEDDFVKISGVSEPGSYSLGAGNSITLGEEPIVNTPEENETETDLNETLEEELNETEMNETG